MARTPKSIQDIAKGVGSKVLLAARLRSGAGKHGGSAKQKNRKERRQSKQDLKQ